MLVCFSSLTGSKKAAPWQQYIGEDGHVFYVELTRASQAQTVSAHKTDASSVCSLCSTRSCHSCASEDTGYSSDTDALLTLSKNRKSEQSVLDISHESLSSSHLTKVADLEDDDDGVSVDLLDFERSSDQGARTKFERQYDDGDLCERLTLECNVGKSRVHHGRHRTLGCTRTSSLCERHSHKLCAPENHSSNSEFTSEHHQTCTCLGQSNLMSHSQSKRKLRDPCREVTLHLRPSGHVWDGRSKISWLESVLGIVPGHADTGKTRGEKKDGADSEKVVIKGLAPDGAAIKSKELLIGKYQLINT